MEDRSYKKGTTMSTDGITVHQLYTDEELAVPAIVLKLVSNRDDSATVVLRVPEPTAQRVGFHPEFENEAWEITDEGLVFETTLAPEAEITTLYAVETDDETAVGAAMDTLKIESVKPSQTDESQEEPTGDDGESDETPVDPEDELVDVSDGMEAVEANSEIDPEADLIDLDDGEKAAIATDFDLGVDEIDTEVTMDQTEDLPEDEPREMEDDQMDEPDRHDEPEMETDAEESEPDDKQPATNVVSAEPTDDEMEMAGTTALTDYPTEELVSELANRASAENLPTEARERLVSLGENGDSRGAVRDAQIDHLQSRVSDIEAFTDTLEAVLEQHGQPADVFEAHTERLTAVEDEVSSLNDSMAETTDAVSELEPQVDAVESGLQSVENEIESVSADVAATTEDVDTMRGDVKELERGQDDLKSDVTTLQDWRKKITGALEAFTGE